MVVFDSLNQRRWSHDRRMIRTGDEYRESIRDGREVWINGERVDDVTTHPRSSRSSTSARASTTWQHEPATARRHDLRRRGDRRALRHRAEAADDAAGLAGQARARRCRDRRRSAASSPASATRRSARCGRSTTARTCSTRSTRSSPRTSSATSSARYPRDPFHVSANTDPKGDRSKRPQDQDPDMLLHVVRETDRRHRRARRQVRDRRGLRQPGLRQADDRQLGRRRAIATTRSASSSTWARRA